MKKLASLQSFFDTYIKNQSISNGTADYQAYIAEQSAKIDDTYNDALERLYSDSVRSRSTYGTTAQALSNMGLTNSGYAKFIDSQSKSMLKAGKDDIISKESDKRSELGASYKDYIKDYVNNRNKLTASITDKLINNGILDYNSAYSYAVSAGLSDKEAKVASQNAYNALRQNVITSIVTKLTDMHLTTDMATTLAKSYGLNAADVERVRNYALFIEGKKTEVSDEFLKELEDMSDRLTG